MSYSLEQLRDQVLRRRVEVPIPSEANLELVANELRYSVVALAALIGKTESGMTDDNAAVQWIGRAQMQLVLLAHMLGINLDAATYAQLATRNAIPPTPHRSPAIQFSGCPGRFAIAARLWLDRPRVVERILQDVCVRAYRYSRVNKVWEFLAYSEHFRPAPAHEEAPRYEVIVTQQGQGPIMVTWQEEEESKL
jgi:hypothetical protein